jgi:DNA-binding XRE family transcriptional regulator
MKTVYGAEWLLPEAPERVEEERKCEKCGYYVNHYTKEQGYGGRKYLICNPCDKERGKEGQNLQEFVGIERAAKKTDTTATYTLRNLKSRREEEGWTQAQVGERAGISETTVREIEKKRRGATRETMEALAQALGCSERALTRKR